MSFQKQTSLKNNQSELESELEFEFDFEFDFSLCIGCPIIHSYEYCRL